MGRLFGTDGVRGVANTELSGDLAFRLGQAGAYALTGGAETRAVILVGCDTRVSCDMLKAALMAGICSTGAVAMDVGVIPTPAVAYLTRTTDALAGVMISASHNPVEDNGIKFFDENGYKLSDETEDAIERLMEELTPDRLPKGGQVGRIRTMSDASEIYMNFLRSTIDIELQGLHIVVDGANGASSYIAPALLQSLGANVTVLSCEPDGLNINMNCGSTHPERIQQYVKQLGADVGLAFDGDADRLIAVDDRGELFDGDHVLAVCALDLREKGSLPQGKVVGTVMSNLGLKNSLKTNALELLTTAVGDRYVLECMRDGDHPLGGEQSGHIIFLEHSTTGDGMLAALQLLRIMKKKAQPLSALREVMASYPQVLINVQVTEQGKAGLKGDEEIAARVREMEAHYGDNGRILIRPSGTEPLIRVMIEGENPQRILEDAQALADLINQRLGAGAQR